MDIRSPREEDDFMDGFAPDTGFVQWASRPELERAPTTGSAPVSRILRKLENSFETVVMRHFRRLAASVRLLVSIRAVALSVVGIEAMAALAGCASEWRGYLHLKRIIQLMKIRQTFVNGCGWR